MAAIALSGFNFEKSAIWRAQCSTAQTQISDPYLRAIFAFLLPDNGSFEKVLVSVTLSLVGGAIGRELTRFGFAEREQHFDRRSDGVCLPVLVGH